MAENNLGNTQYFRTKPDQELQVKEVLDLVYNAMDEKGYNPVNQIVGYIMSGDPTYITSHKGARSMIMKVSEIIRSIMDEKNCKPIDLAKRLGISKQTLNGRLTQDNISIDKLNEMLKQMDYKIVIDPNTSKSKGSEVE